MNQSAKIPLGSIFFQLDQKQPKMLQSLSMLLQWPGLNLFTDSQKQPSQPINIFYTLSLHCQGKNRQRQRALDYSNTKAWWMSFAFCMCLFLFLSFCIWNQAFLSRICKFRWRMAVWLPEKLLSFPVASVLNWARRFECYKVLLGQTLTFVQWKKNACCLRSTTGRFGRD